MHDTVLMLCLVQMVPWISSVHLSTSPLVKHVATWVNIKKCHVLSIRSENRINNACEYLLLGFYLRNIGIIYDIITDFDLSG